MSLSSENLALEAIRLQIEQVDRHIVALLAERGACALQAVSLKSSLEAIQSPERMERTLAKIRLISQEQGANPAVVQQIYRSLLTAFMVMECDEFKSLHQPDTVRPFNLNS